MMLLCEYTYEQLAAFAAGEAGGDAGEIAAHAAHCPQCRTRLEALKWADDALAAAPALTPPPAALERIRHTLRQAATPTTEPEIMTLDEVAAFLRLSEAQMDEIADELPAFELPGGVRVRRAKLIEWINNRERVYRLASLQSDAARLLSDAF